MANGGRYPMGTGWQAGVQTRVSLGIVYRYSAYLPGGPGYRGRGGTAFTPSRRGGFAAGAKMPMRLGIRGGR